MPNPTSVYSLNRSNHIAYTRHSSENLISRRIELLYKIEGVINCRDMKILKGRSMEQNIGMVNNNTDIPNLQEDPRPWGIWATIGFAILISIVFVILQSVVPVVMIVIKKAQDPSLNIEKFAASLGSNGLALGLGVILSGTITSGLVLLLAKIKKGITLKQYFKLNSIRLKDCLIWLSVMGIFIVVTDCVSYLVKGEIVPDVMHKQYETAVFLPLFLFAIIVIAPLFEELFFRGFLFEGIRRSKLGNIGAVLITSLFWAGIHLQYVLFLIMILFFSGIMLGIARLKTNSLYTTILLHSAMNIVASGECIFINEFLR